jgi:hypothetical protein
LVPEFDAASPEQKEPIMRHITWKLVGVAVAACVSTAVVVTPITSASARLPRCTDDPASCDPPGGPGGTTEPPAPDPQPQPPQPFGPASAFTYLNFGATALAGIDARLNAAPEPADVWPLATIPYTPEIANAAVKIVHVKENLWAFVSYDAGARPGDCVGSCSSVPEMPLNPNYGLYQATLRLRPRLDIEIYKVETGTDGQGHPTPLAAHFVTEATATVHMRAFAECNGWETGTATLNAQIGVVDVTFRRDPDIAEKFWNFVFPGTTASQNAEIHHKLVDTIGIDKYEVNPLANGKPCYTLGVVGDASSGAIVWNELPCIMPESGCPPGGGVNSQ